MTDGQSETARATDAAHGVHGASREDGGPQEDPAPAGAPDNDAWADATETGGDATS
jgi:hypothetical protein